MDKKTVTPLVIILALMFIGFGDRVLPKPLSTASFNTRTALNNSLLGLFPTKKPRNVYERTEKAIEQEEKGGK